MPHSFALGNTQCTIVSRCHPENSLTKATKTHRGDDYSHHRLLLKSRSWPSNYCKMTFLERNITKGQLYNSGVRVVPRKKAEAKSSMIYFMPRSLKPRLTPQWRTMWDCQRLWPWQWWPRCRQRDLCGQTQLLPASHLYNE